MQTKRPSKLKSATFVALVGLTVDGCKAQIEASKSASSTPDGPSEFNSLGPCTLAYNNLIAGGDRIGQKFPTVQTITQYLNDKPGSGRQFKDGDIYDFLDDLAASDPNLEQLYNCDSGVRERVKGGIYSIRFHTERVLQVLNDQRRFYQLPERNLNYQTLSSYPLIVWLAAVHDVGKPVAVELYNSTHEQHQFVPVAAKAVLEKLKFPPHQVQVGVALVEHDLVGSYLKKRDVTRQDQSEVLSCLAGQAAKAGLGLKDFWTLQRLFYIADSTSYAYVRHKFFQVQMPRGGVVHFSPYDTSLDDQPLQFIKTDRGESGLVVSKSGRLEELTQAIEEGAKPTPKNCAESWTAAPVGGPAPAPAAGAGNGFP